ncbi:AgmX/PglI C-terminal domain-containing protein [Alcanivorax sp. PA15-N-34]|uniref:AgmX/PglI C-terminal domain-containing protein n=2 Tax=Alcanivorax sediminis TaxID=2663008 RepID=A0A6N7LW18_9GAMM|nr:AgmX/PglI C-terminal domain-containing protein [Alcanivorax sediminis]
MRLPFLMLSLTLLLGNAVASEGNRGLSGQEGKALVGKASNRNASDESCERGSIESSALSLINHTFCRYKPKFDSHYRRALRDEPFLQGNVTFRLEVKGDGKVASVEIIQSDLSHSELERRFLMIASAMQFPGIGPDGWEGEYILRFSS